MYIVYVVIKYHLGVGGHSNKYTIISVAINIATIQISREKRKTKEKY